MRLGIGTYTYAWNIGVAGNPPPNPMSRLELLQQAARLGAQTVQFCENLPLDSLPESELRVVESVARDLGLHLEVGTRGTDADTIKRCAVLAQRFGSGFIRLVIDKGHDEPSADEAVRRLAPIAADLGNTRMAIENHDRFPVATLVKMVEAIGGGVCLDTANSLGSLEGTEHVVRTLAPYTLCLHIKDVRAKRVSSMMGFTITGTAAGDGQLDIPWIMEEVRSRGQAESLILELWPPQETPGVPPVELERAMAERGMQYLRELPALVAPSS